MPLARGQHESGNKGDGGQPAKIVRVRRETGGPAELDGAGPRNDIAG